MSISLKKSDTVVVQSGKDAGKKGKILRVFPRDRKILVEGVNEVKRHQKAKRSGQKGQMVAKITPIHASSALYFCDKCGKGVRMGAKMVGTKKMRVCKGCGAELA
jgi:large subunit ribosomal protein L24